MHTFSRGRQRALSTTLLVACILWPAASRNAAGGEAHPHGKDTCSEPTVRIQPRYYRWLVDPGEQWIEKNTGYAHLDWEIPISQVAVVLVDVWDRHYLEDPEERAEKIIQQKIRPLLSACRRAGLEIIHAPAPQHAKAQPGWVGHRAEDSQPARAAQSGAAPSWPPAEFRSKTGPYRKFARPAEPTASERAERLDGITIHPDVQPAEGEAVVATGDELHRYCSENEILFLLYAGFNTNACILMRDYGTLEMRKRGYEVVLLRDCTTGMESCETTEQLDQTRAAILTLEMFGHYSASSEEVIDGLDSAAR